MSTEYPAYIVVAKQRVGEFVKLRTLMKPASIQHSKHATNLQHWLECKDFILCMKAMQMGSLPINTDSLRHCKVTVNNVIESDKKGNKEIAQQLDKFNKHWLETFGASATMAKEIEATMVADMAKLSEVDLDVKREVLRYMPVVPTPLAAAYLGVSPDALRRMKEYEPDLFGEHYAGSHCYSMEELNLIARNMHWSFPFPEVDCGQYREESDGTELDHVTMVDEEVACAFTDMTASELSDQAPRTRLERRRYRLSDLEKIRTAQMNQSLT